MPIAQSVYSLSPYLSPIQWIVYIAAPVPSRRSPPISPYISLYLPASPCISPHLPAQVSRETRGGRHTLVLVDRVFEHGYLTGDLP